MVMICDMVRQTLTVGSVMGVAQCRPHKIAVNISETKTLLVATTRWLVV
jgi:hypothetical protein